MHISTSYSATSSNPITSEISSNKNHNEELVTEAKEVMEQQADMHKREHDKSVWQYIRQKWTGLRLVTTDKPPAIRTEACATAEASGVANLWHPMHTAPTPWSAEIARAVVMGSWYEAAHIRPDNIDVAALAKVVHATETKREQRKAENAWLPRMATDPGWQKCDDAIKGWIKACYLNKQLDVRDVQESFGNAGVGYEHLGKSIWLSFVGRALGIAMMPVNEAWTLSWVTMGRGGIAAARMACNLNIGTERLKTKPREDLAPRLSLSPSGRLKDAPGMREMAQRAGALGKAGDIAHRLQQALDKRDLAAVKSLLKEAVALKSEEESVKAGLTPSAIEWAGNGVRFPVRAATVGVGVGGFVTSLAVPPVAPIVLPATTAAAAALHLGYHFFDGARSDSRDKLEAGFHARIRSYDWLVKQEDGQFMMTPAEIKNLYQSYKDKKITRKELKQTLLDNKAFDLNAVSAATQLPFTVRLGIGEKLLTAKLSYTGERYHSDLKQRESLAAKGGKGLSAWKLRKLDKRIGEREALIRSLAADRINFHKARELLAQAATAPARAKDLLDEASGYLFAIQDKHVRNLFCGTLKQQARAGEIERKLKAGEHLKYWLSYNASSVPSSVVGDMGAIAGITAQEIECTVQWAEQGYPVHSTFPDIPELKMANVGLEVTGAALMHSGPLTSSLRIPYDKRFGHRLQPEHLQEIASPGKEKEAVPVQRVAVALSGRPCQAQDIPDEVLQLFHGEDRPEKLVLDLGNAERVNLKLSDTQPYVEHNVKSKGLKGVYRKESVKVLANLAGEGIAGTVYRPVASQRLLRSREGRRELDAVVDKARAFLRDPEVKQGDEPRQSQEEVSD